MREFVIERSQLFNFFSFPNPERLQQCVDASAIGFLREAPEPSPDPFSRALYKHDFIFLVRYDT